jgi:hypothetical protein
MKGKNFWLNRLIYYAHWDVLVSCGGKKKVANVLSVTIYEFFEKI